MNEEFTVCDDVTGMHTSNNVTRSCSFLAKSRESFRTNDTGIPADRVRNTLSNELVDRRVLAIDRLESFHFSGRPILRPSRRRQSSSFSNDPLQRRIYTLLHQYASFESTTQHCICRPLSGRHGV